VASAELPAAHRQDAHRRRHVEGVGRLTPLWPFERGRVPGPRP
jgi:hypothetical protein